MHIYPFTNGLQIPGLITRVAVLKWFLNKGAFVQAGIKWRYAWQRGGSYMKQGDRKAKSTVSKYTQYLSYLIQARTIYFYNQAIFFVEMILQQSPEIFNC